MPKRVRTTRRLEVWLKDTDLALFVLNAQRRLVFFNHGCERLTGWTGADVLGQKCDYVSEADSHSTAALLAALAPPPEAWTGTLTQAPVNVPHREAAPTARIVAYFPLVDEEQHVKAMLGVMVPVPQRTTPDDMPASQRLHAELAALRQSVRRRYGEGTLIGRSPPMQRAFSQLKLAQSMPTPVLFIGETGVGKQHLARVLHYQGPQSRRAFVPFDCRRSSTRELEEALTRIREDQRADALRTGAVFFDHVDSAPSDFQRSLVEWIETNTGPAAVRVLAGSPRSLETLVDEERFSRELYFALTTLVIQIPPLRERMEDMELLAQHFLEELNRETPEQVGGFSESVRRQFRRYNWPGNVGELRHVVTEARAACPGPTVETEHLPFRFRTGVTAQTVGLASRPRIQPLDPFLEQVEREQIEQALVECRHNKARAAELLGISRPRLYRRMELLGIADLESKPDTPDNTPDTLPTNQSS
jgi:DNA-binding NtrC family response regulator